MSRIVGLVAMDYFFAQIEERENPLLKGKPVVVCVYSGRGKESGAVSTCNYEARKLGIHSAMAIFQAKKRAEKNPETVFVAQRIDFYRQESEKIMQIVRQATNGIETIGLDEAYFDITKKANGSFAIAKKLCEALKKEIWEKQKLTASIGLGPNKVIAKIAASEQKPNGLTIVTEKETANFIAPKPIQKLPGVGRKTTQQLQAMGIQTIQEMRGLSKTRLAQITGEARGQYLYNACRGMDERKVETSVQRKQFSRIATLEQDSADEKKIAGFLDSLAKELFVRVQKAGVLFKTVSVIMVSNQLQNKIKNKTLPVAVKDLKTIQETSRELVKAFFEQHPGIVIRRAGIRVGNLQCSSKKEKTVNLMDFV